MARVETGRNDSWHLKMSSSLKSLEDLGFGGVLLSETLFKELNYLSSDHNEIFAIGEILMCFTEMTFLAMR